PPAWAHTSMVQDPQYDKGREESLQMNVSLSSQCLAIFYFYKAYTLRQSAKKTPETAEERVKRKE
ncbi:MAG TPA: hypothetical protein VKA68_10130, partial [bacterium]|nr:hypothetical protein [bacterium]